MANRMERLTRKDAVALGLVLSAADVQPEDLMATASCSRAVAADHLRRADKVARVLLDRRSQTATPDPLNTTCDPSRTPT